MKLLKLGLPWRSQYFGDARIMRYLPIRAADTEWNCPKREEYVAVGKAGRTEPSKPFDIRHGGARFGVGTARF